MSILIKPIITEKANDLSELYNRFTFKVDKRANKIEIKDAVEKTYGVSVKNVNTMVYPVKRNTKHTKRGVVVGKLGAYKKAVIELADGDSIDFYSNI